MQIERWQASTATLVAVVVAYAVFLADQVLLGLFVGAFVYLLAWLYVHMTPETEFRAALGGTRRASVVGVLMLFVAGYSLFIADQLLLGALTVVAISLVAWITSPSGPLAGD